MKKTLKSSIKYIGCGALATSVLVAACLSVACRGKVKVPDMNISYGPEIGIADGQVDLSGETPIISISAIKAEVGMNIDYLSGVNIANEGDFPDLEIWVDASTVDIFTPGNYTAIYTFNYNDKTVSEEVTVTITESQTEQSASENSSTSKNNNSVGSNEATSSKVQQTTSKNQSTSKNENTSKEENSSNEQQTTSKEPGTTTKEQPSSSKEPGTTTKPPTSTIKPPTTTTKPTATTTKPTTSKGPTTSKKQNTTDDTTTTREIITTSGNKETASKYIGNYTIELLSGKTVTIRNTTSKYIVSTRTDVSYKDRNGYTYKVSKLIITYNTGAEQILETVEERME